VYSCSGKKNQGRFRHVGSDHSLLNPGLTSGLFPGHSRILSHVSYTPCQSHPPLLDHSNYIWHGVQVMMLLIMQFSPVHSPCKMQRYRDPEQHTTVLLAAEDRETAYFRTRRQRTTELVTTKTSMPWERLKLRLRTWGSKCVTLTETGRLSAVTSWSIYGVSLNVYCRFFDETDGFWGRNRPTLANILDSYMMMMTIMMVVMISQSLFFIIIRLSTIA
jgi:hypothetical protein